MNRIVLILPFFGKLPNTFNFFLQSCKNNLCIDWLIFTDCRVEEFNNIKVINQSWDCFKDFVQSKFSFKIVLDSPYKLCDFKPAYGYIFEDYIKGYDYWGHCDCDLIWGNLLTLYNFIDKGYDRIGIWGHLSLYKNTNEVNRWFETLHSVNVPSCKVVFCNSKNFSFDEFAGMNKLLSENNKVVNDDRFFDDIIFYTKNFFSRRNFNGIKITHSVPCYFIYENGLLFRKVFIDNKWVTDESMYVHLQKRKMTIKTTNLNSYTIIPNQFIDTDIYSDSQILKLTKAPTLDWGYYKMILKCKISRIVKKK